MNQEELKLTSEQALDQEEMTGLKDGLVRVEEEGFLLQSDQSSKVDDLNKKTTSGIDMAYIMTDEVHDKVRELPKTRPYLEGALSRVVAPDDLQKRHEHSNHTLSRELFLCLAAILKETNGLSEGLPDIKERGGYLGPGIDNEEKRHIKKILVNYLAVSQAEDAQEQALGGNRRAAWATFNALRSITSDARIEEIEYDNDDVNGDNEKRAKYKVSVPASKDMFGSRELIKKQDAEQVEKLLDGEALLELFSCGLLPERVVCQTIEAFPAGVDLTMLDDEPDFIRKAKVIDTTVRELGNSFDVLKLLGKFKSGKKITKSGLSFSIGALRARLESHCQDFSLSDEQRKQALAYKDRVTVIEDQLHSSIEGSIAETLSGDELNLTPKQQNLLQKRITALAEQDAESHGSGAFVNRELEDIFNQRSSNALIGLPVDQIINMPRLINTAHPGTVTFERAEDGRPVVFVDPSVSHLPAAKLVIDALARLEESNNLREMADTQSVSKETIALYYNRLSRLFTLNENQSLLKPPEEELSFSGMITDVLEQIEAKGFLKPFEGKNTPASNLFVANAIQADVFARIGRLKPEDIERLLVGLASGNLLDLIRAPSIAREKGLFIENPDFAIIKERSERKPRFSPQEIERRLLFSCPGLDEKLIERLANWSWQTVKLMKNLSEKDWRSAVLTRQAGALLIGWSGVGKTRLAIRMAEIINELVRRPFNIIVADMSGMVQSGVVGRSMDNTVGFNLITQVMLKYKCSVGRAAEIINSGQERFFLVADEIGNKIVAKASDRNNPSAEASRVLVMTEFLGLLTDSTSLRVQVPMPNIPGYRAKLETQFVVAGTGSLGMLLNELEVLHPGIKNDYGSINEAHLLESGVHPDLLARMGVYNLGRVGVNDLHVALTSNIGQLRGVETVIRDVARQNRMPVAGVSFSDDSAPIILEFIEQHKDMQYRALDMLAQNIAIQSARLIDEARTDEEKRRELLHEINGQAHLIIPASLVDKALRPHMKSKRKKYY